MRDQRIPQNIKLTTSDDIGIPTACKDAGKVVKIAYSALQNGAGNSAEAGHASHNTILAKIALAPRNIDKKLID